MHGIARLLIVTLMTALLASCGGGGGGGAPAGGGGGITVGLDARPQNLTCLAPDLTGGSAQIQLDPVFTGLNFAAPINMLQAPGDNSRWFVAERGGRVRVFANNPAVSTFDADLISIAVNTSGEGGLLGMAFHPSFATNRQVFLSWTEGSQMVSVIARFTSIDGGLTLDPGSQQDIIRVNQDFSNHNGGHIAFGPDGYLYIGLGDGGSGSDPNDRAQDTTNLLGSMLRLDVDGPSATYDIPTGATGNPFAANAVCAADHSSTQSCPEIFSWGLRNPWRWSFDRQTGDLWAGDVGQNSFEEISVIERGGNYGWDCREGLVAHSPAAASCSAANGLIDPVHVYGRSDGVSITGGYVYRGAAIPGLIGSYIFADFVSGSVWRLVDNGSGGFTSEILATGAGSIASFAEGNDGELYAVDISGELLAINAATGGGGGGGGANPVPALLSDTGCFNAQNPSQPVSGLIPYSASAPFWSDGAVKERWFAIPNGAVINLDADGDFGFPRGSVLAKHFRLGSELVETRLMMHHPDGTWAGYTYEWNSTGTDANLVTGGLVTQKAGQDWIYPSAGQCLQCHTQVADFALGLEVSQLNNDFTYTATGRTHNQLQTLDVIGMFAAPLGDPTAQPGLPDPADTSRTLAERARSYLHTNCAQCHRAGGPTPVALDLQYTVDIASAGICNAMPQAGDLGIANALLIAPGEPARSVLLERVNRRDANAMPPLASNIIDSVGVTLLSDWITAMDASCR